MGCSHSEKCFNNYICGGGGGGGKFVVVTRVYIIFLFLLLNIPAINVLSKNKKTIIF